MLERMPILINDSYTVNGSMSYVCEGCKKPTSPTKLCVRWFVTKYDNHGGRSTNAHHTHTDDKCIGAFLRYLAEG